MTERAADAAHAMLGRRREETNARAEKETSRRWVRNQRWRWRGNG